MDQIPDTGVERIESVDDIFEAATDHYQNGRFEEASTFYRKIVQIKPGHIPAWNNLGLVLHGLGRYEEAISCYSRVLAVNHQIAETNYNLGNSYFALKNLHGAISSYLNAIRIRPDYPDALNNLFVTLKKRNDHEVTISCLEQVFQIHPDRFEVSFFLGNAFFAAGNVEKAIASYRKASELKPDEPESFFHLGLLHRKAGNPEAAGYFYRQTIERNPEYWDAYNNLGLVLADLGKQEEAIQVFQDLILKNPDYPKAHVNLKILLKNDGNPDDAIACYEKMIQLNPRIPEVHYHLGNTIYEYGLYERSRPCFQKAGEINPNFAQNCLNRLRIETSSACNLRCQHCPTGVSYCDTQRAVMPMDLFNMLLQQMKKIPTLSECVMYLGGEPLLNRHFSTMCRRVKEETHVTYTQFNTNAMLINEKICEQLQESHVDHIGISIDGRSPLENNTIRQGADYHTIVKNVRLLRHYLPNTLISIDNTLIKHPGDPDTPGQPDFLLKDFSGLPIQSTYAMKWPGLNLSGSSLHNLSVAGYQSGNFRICKMPFTQAAVRSNGDVVFCCYDLTGASMIGNILDRDLLDIWKSEAYQDIRHHMLSFQVNCLPDICRKCTVYTDEILLQND